MSTNNTVQVAAQAWLEHCNCLESLLQELLIVETASQHDATLKPGAWNRRYEEDLIADVHRLQCAMDRQQKEMKNMVSSSKYMQAHLNKTLI